MSMGVFEEPTHRDALRAAWHEFRAGVAARAFCLQEKDYGGAGFPAPIAWLRAPWKPLAYRFKPFNLERVFRPKKAERRQRVHDLCEYVFICGASEWDEDRWAEADALVAEFGIDFPPRDWEPFSAAETVGAIMGMSREEVANSLAQSEARRAARTIA